MHDGKQIYHFAAVPLDLHESGVMEETIKQKQVGKLVQRALSDVFLQEGKEILSGALVTVSHVRMTPDLLVARAYLSVFNTPNPDEIMAYIQYNNKQIRGIIGKKIRNQVRRIPELEFFKDDTLDEVFRMEELFKDLREKRGQQTDEEVD